jgi:hypothetical protein
MTATDTNLTDAVTATAVLVKTRDALGTAVDRRKDAVAELRGAIVSIRPQGILTVDEMAEAVDRDRNYIDAVWSNYGDGDKGKQTRVALADVSDREQARAVDLLADRAAGVRRALDAEDVARKAHHRNIALAYGAAIKGFGPSAISGAAGVDRNHVLRISRAAKIAPVWRQPGTSRNQHTAAK